MLQLLNMTGSKVDATNTDASRGTFDSIDPVDTPLYDLQQRSALTVDIQAEDQLHLTQYADHLPTTKPISCLGTAQSIIPNYTAFGNERLFASPKNKHNELKTQSNTTLSEQFITNETYVSDDDIDAVDSTEATDDNDKVDCNGVINDNTEGSVSNQNISHEIQNKSSGGQLFENKDTGRKGYEKRSFPSDSTFKVNNQPKQARQSYGNRTTSPNPFASKLNVPQLQSSYFANQVQYFPSFASSSFARSFINPLGNIIPEHYHRHSPQPGFRCPAPCDSVQIRSMPPGNNELNHLFVNSPSVYDIQGFDQATPHTCTTYRFRPPNNPMALAFTSNCNRKPEHPIPNQSMPLVCTEKTHSERRNAVTHEGNASIDSTAILNTTGSFNFEPESTITPPTLENKANGTKTVNREPRSDNVRTNQLTPDSFVHDKKARIAPTSTTDSSENFTPNKENTITNCAKKCSGPAPSPSKYDNKGFIDDKKALNSARVDMKPRGNPGAIPPLFNNVTHGNKGTAYSTVTISGTKGLNPAEAKAKLRGNYGSNHPAPNDSTLDSKRSIHSTRNGSDSNGVNSTQADTKPRNNHGSNHAAPNDPSLDNKRSVDSTQNTNDAKEPISTEADPKLRELLPNNPTYNKGALDPRPNVNDARKHNPADASNILHGNKKTNHSKSIGSKNGNKRPGKCVSTSAKTSSDRTCGQIGRKRSSRGVTQVITQGEPQDVTQGVIQDVTQGVTRGVTQGVTQGKLPTWTLKYGRCILVYASYYLRVIKSQLSSAIFRGPLWKFANDHTE